MKKNTIHFEVRKKVCQVGQVGRVVVFPEKYGEQNEITTWQGLPS
jgi:hypothetical protein